VPAGKFNAIWVEHQQGTQKTIVAFRAFDGWPHVVEDLILRAKGSGRQVRVVEG
jgi:hypothetical protein